MKKKILFFTLFTALYSFSANINSQTVAKFGLRGGVQISGVSNVHMSSQKKTGGSFGAFAMFPLNEKGNYTVQAELNYSLQGEFGKNSENEGNKIDFGQDYLTVPVLFKYNIFDFYSINNFFIEAGPQISFLVGQKSKDIDAKEYGKPNSFDFSIAMGLGYRLQNHYELGLRYNLGITDIYKSLPGSSNTGVSGIYFGYIF